MHYYCSDLVVVSKVAKFSVTNRPNQLCLACRNMQRAEAARLALLNSHRTGQVTLVQMNSSSISAAQEVILSE